MIRKCLLSNVVYVQRIRQIPVIVGNSEAKPFFVVVKIVKSHISSIWIAYANFRGRAEENIQVVQTVIIRIHMTKK